ncbi:hypothetical protein [Hydrogeniiclostridium mannosilyticum]|uniref:hypothetical protein n=1 Tax=Hydrogeniiclostridium mannosilyticum TaxID=2764322 RepID=UPI003999E790
MRTLADEKKGITVKIDAELHAQVKEYIEQHGITMAEFVTMALDDELHPKFEQKEKNNMGNMRTVAFQVPEELFQRLKDYLHRNDISQKDFVLGLIEDELDREQTERENASKNEQFHEDDEDEILSEDGTAEDFEPDDISEAADITDIDEDEEGDEYELEDNDEYEAETEKDESEDESEEDAEDESESENETAGFSMGM